MKTKFCALCKQEFTVMYRIRLEKGRPWIFACKSCTEAARKRPQYTYGGTWKGARH